MNRIGVVTLIVLLSCACLTGCPPKKESSIGSEIDPNPRPAMSGDPVARVGELHEQVAAFERARRAININSPGDGRQQIAATFGALSRVLTTLEGPNPTGAFRQQVRIIDTNRQRLAESSADLAAEPTINAAFRAASRALDGIAAQQYPEDAELRGLLDGLRGRVDELDNVRGPLHRLVVTHAFTSAAQVVNRMAGVLQERVGAGRADEPAPAPAPEPAPAPQPAEPAPQPPAEPAPQPPAEQPSEPAAPAPDPAQPPQ